MLALRAPGVRAFIALFIAISFLAFCVICQAPTAIGAQIVPSPFALVDPPDSFPSAASQDGGAKKNDEDDGGEGKSEDDEEAAEDEDYPDPPPSVMNQPFGFDAKTQTLFDEAYGLWKKAHSRQSEKKALESALSAMEKVKSAAPSSPVPHFLLGRLHCLQENWARARTSFKRATELAPGFYEAHAWLGTAFAEERKHGEAVAHFLKAIEINPTFGNALYWAVYSLTTLGRFAEAEKFVARAEKHFGKNEILDRYAKAIRLATKGPGWKATHEFESENYVIRTDVSRELAERMSEQIELIRLVYDKVFPEIPKPDRKYVVLIFKERDDYLAAGNDRNTVGTYHPLPRTLMLYLRPDEADTISTLKHEGFHQYCHEYLDNIPT